MMKKQENQFHEDYLQGKRDDQYRFSAKSFFWLVVVYAIGGGLYIVSKAFYELFFK